MAEKSIKSDATNDIAQDAAETMLGPNPFVGLRPKEMVESLTDLWSAMWQNPAVMIDRQSAFVRDLIFPPESAGKAAPGDKRFADPEWANNPFYKSLLTHYLAWSRSLAALPGHVDVDDVTRERARFLLTLIADAFSPTNTLLGNPAALKKTIETRGANLASGFSNLIGDLAKNGGMPAQVDQSAFKVGKDLAATPGAVIFRNEVLELIHYAPTTAEVQARPHLFIPPQINKFYVFDLSPGKSLVQFLVDNGFQVFLVSWRNPTAEHRDWDVGTYVAALQEAINVVREVTGSDDLIVHAACSGAMTSIVLAAVLASEAKPFIHAMTLMVAVLGNDTDTQLGMFATPDLIEIAKQEVALKGVLEGKEMGRVFAWMRPNDLIWNYWVNNYLLGNPPPRFDILYWNNDTTRLPAKFHAALLDILGQGLLLQRDAVKINGTPIDIGKITVDKFVVAGTTDHITPWRGVYKMTQALGGNSEFVLSSSGHIQSLVNPPGNPKAKFNTASELAPTPEDWLAKSTAMQGSWWEYWAEWLRERSGDRKASPAHLGNAEHPPQGPAPGTYVHES